MARDFGAVRPEVREDAVIRLLQTRTSDNGLTKREITEYLNKKNGWKFSRKCYERDLDRLSHQQGIVSDSQHPERFSLAKGFKASFQLKVTDESIPALAMSLSLFKASAPEYLGAMTDGLEAQILGSLPTGLIKTYELLKSVILVQDSSSGRSKQNIHGQLALVLEAFKKEVAITCRYQSRVVKDGKDPSRFRKFGLVALEMFWGSLYLIIHDFEKSISGEKPYKRVKFSRMSDVKLTTETFVRPTREAYIEWVGSFEGVGGSKNNPVAIRITGNSELREYFTDCQINCAQKVTSVEGEDKVCVELLMPISKPLVRLLAGFGDAITTLEPEELKNQVRRVWMGGLDVK